MDVMPYDSYDDEGEHIGSDACPQLDLMYAPADVAGDIVEEYFDVYLMSADCAQAEDAAPFVSGDYGDLPVREAANGLVQALVGDTVVEVDTSLGDDMVTAALTSLQPFDLDAELARISAEAEAMWNEDMPVG
jgi:hypothetical protein